MISQLGRFEVVGELGQGAMGIVYKAKDPLIDRTVALKTISLNVVEDEKEEYERRFYQEAKAAGRLNHQNIVTIYDVGKSGDIAYIAMEFLEGRELRDVLNEEPLLPIDQVLDIVIQIAQGLAYAHEYGIVHRDIKPSNIMCVRDGHVKITDFGIARMTSASVRTQTGLVLGSPKYMSPEQVLGQSIDSRSDIFSLGVMLYEMLTGQVPFLGSSINAIMYQTVNAVPSRPSEVSPTVPVMLDYIVTKALAKIPDERYRDAMEFANDLRACRDTVPRSMVHADLRRSRLRQSDTQLTAPIHLIRRGEAKEEGLDTVSTLRLSSNFNSIEATMRLAEMTAPDFVAEQY
jgi:serine/threonine protein kinase